VLAREAVVPVRTLLAAGAGALARGTIDVARLAYERALDASVDGSERAEAAAGLARAARAANDVAAAASALTQAAHPDGSPDADLIARIAMVARRAAGGHGG
jgi:thioredoxin-like negative regulator of GroEL